jgi:putative membrane protein
MSSQDNVEGPDRTLRPQVFVMDAPQATDGLAAELLTPRVTATAQTGRIVPAPPPELPVTASPRPRRRHSLTVRLGIAGLIAAFCGWLGVDLYRWIASAFDFSTGLGWAAAVAATAGIVGAGAIIAHEVRSYFAIKNVEATQQRLATPWETMRPADMQEAIREVIAEIPKDRESKAAIEAFQRNLQRHHAPAQQIELLSQTVMHPLDRRAETIVRRASLRSFGIVAISPTAVTDALFFVACAVRMVREIAGCYGHRPTALATAHLLRRLVVEAGKLGVIDLAGATLTQQIGGAVAERIATSAAESLYAGQRMARLGLVTMGLCRPIPFERSEVPGVWSSLIGHLFARPAESPQEKGAP